jgi:hypothetical protein
MVLCGFLLKPILLLEFFELKKIIKKDQIRSGAGRSQDKLDKCDFLLSICSPTAAVAYKSSGHIF